MALGEAACVSVHGANRLGSNSLIDLVVFGRAAAERCAELIEPGEKHAELPRDSAELPLVAARPLPPCRRRDSDRRIAPAHAAVMQTNCAVFRTGEVLEEGSKLIHEVLGGVGDAKVFDRSLIWNSDLVETLEFDNLIAQAVVTMDSAANRTKAAAPMPARIFPTATTRTG